MWNTPTPEPLRQSILEAISLISSRMREPEYVAEVANAAVAASTLAIKRHWIPYDVSNGDVSIALLLGHMDACFPDSGWDRVAHTYIARAIQSFEIGSEQAMGVGLVGGLAGLCFTVHYLSRGGQRYQQLLQSLEAILVKQVARLTVQTEINSVGFHDYDLISGPAGIGRYLLLRPEVPGTTEVLHMVLSRLIYLSQEDDGRLRYFVPPQRATEERRRTYPEGFIDCGLAHGVPGPLALLSLAHVQGVEHPGLEDAIERLASWMVAQSYRDEWGINWPYSVSYEHEANETQTRNTRAAWCYGNPGVARALWLAGCALGDSSLRSLALEAMRAVHYKPLEALDIPSPIICHGIAGVLQIAMRFANDTGEDTFTEMSSKLAQQLMLQFQPDAPFGFRHIEAQGNSVDNPGLLEGAAGVTLALLSAAVGMEPAWDRLLLIS